MRSVAGLLEAGCPAVKAHLGEKHFMLSSRNNLLFLCVQNPKSSSSILQQAWNPKSYNMLWIIPVRIGNPASIKFKH